MYVFFPFKSTAGTQTREGEENYGKHKDQSPECQSNRPSLWRGFADCCCPLMIQQSATLILSECELRGSLEMQQPSGPSVCLKVTTDDINTVEEKSKKRGRQGREKTTAKQIVTKFPLHKVMVSVVSHPTLWREMDPIGGFQ